MTNNQQDKKRPTYKDRKGRFQISVWKRKRVMHDPASHQDKEVDSSKACLQYSQYDQESESWENQRIWMFLYEIPNLVDLLKKLLEAEYGAASYEEILDEMERKKSA